MSEAHVERFFTMALEDQRLVSRMLADNRTPEDCITNAVKIAAELGYHFTAREAAAWIRQQAQKREGELPDAQLVDVAGGTSVSYPTSQTLTGISAAFHEGALTIIANLKA